MTTENMTTQILVKIIRYLLFPDVCKYAVNKITLKSLQISCRIKKKLVAFSSINYFGNLSGKVNYVNFCRIYSSKIKVILFIYRYASYCGKSINKGKKVTLSRVCR